MLNEIKYDKFDKYYTYTFAILHVHFYQLIQISPILIKHPLFLIENMVLPSLPQISFLASRNTRIHAHSHSGKAPWIVAHKTWPIHIRPPSLGWNIILKL